MVKCGNCISSAIPETCSKSAAFENLFNAVQLTYLSIFDVFEISFFFSIEQSYQLI